MSATLTLPVNEQSKKMPAIVMVTGSGPQNRDEEFIEHKPFAVIADCPDFKPSRVYEKGEVSRVSH